MESSSAYPLASTLGGNERATPAGVPLSGRSFRPPAGLVRALQAMALVGAVTLVAGSLIEPQRTWANLLIGAYYVVALGLAGVLLIALEYVTGAGWSVAFRRVPEAMAETLPVGAGLFAVVLVISPNLYPAFQEGYSAGGPTAWFREFWLTPAFFIVRSVAYLAVWILFARAIVRRSRAQDQDGLASHSRINARLSAGFLVVFGLTIWLASLDWIMSLDPHWYSTIFGIYHFAGLFLGGLALTTILVLWLERLGPLRGVLTDEHLHDLGKLLFAFSTFWMYIWFSQYMLIWYANIPEETSYFINRLQGFWEPVFYLNVLLNWAVPFLVLLSVRAKRSRGLMHKVCWAILVGRWVDLYWMTLPPFSEGVPKFGVWEIGIIAGAAGVFFLALFRALAAAPAVPLRDPLLEESLHYHN